LVTDTKFVALNRRSFLQGATTFAYVSLLAGCTPGATTVMSNYPSPLLNAQPTPLGPITAASLTVGAATSGSIGSGFAGFSYEKKTLAEPLFTASNTGFVSLFKLLGPGLLRIGGNSVDQMVWTPGGPGRTSGQVAPSDVDALAAFVKAAGWQILYGVNLGGAATGATTPALAAAEVAYAVQAFGSSLLGIEIGNECDLYGDPGGSYAGNWSVAKFETLWKQFRTAIVASSPNVAITGPASASNLDGITQWDIPFGEYVTKSEINLLTQHYYRDNGSLPSSTAAFLISPDTTLVSFLALLQAGAQQIGVPFRITECNSFYGGGSPGVSNSYAASLWVIDFLFNCAQGGAVGVNFEGGDYTDYSAITNAGGTVLQVLPLFYGIYLFTLVGQGTLLQTQLTVGGLNVTAYVVQTAAGGTNIVIVNKDPTQNLSMNIQIPHASTSATLLAMTGPSLASTTGVAIQEASINVDGSFSPIPPYTLTANGKQVSCYVPALSAVLVSIL